jgi:hypothetical protein
LVEDALYNYYRLKEVDKDGAEQFSQVIVIDCEKTAEGRVVLFPNPANDLLSFKFNGFDKLELSYEIFDVTGRIVKQSSDNKIEDDKMELDISDFSGGNYYVKFSDPEGIKNIPVLTFVKE